VCEVMDYYWTNCELRYNPCALREAGSGPLCSLLLLTSCWLLAALLRSSS
jgi:hypothetical protein